MTSGLFVGADPVGLVGLADVADQYAIRLGLIRSAVAEVLARFDKDPALLRDLSATSFELAVASNSLKWRAVAIDTAQRMSIPILGGGIQGASQLAEFASLGVFDLGRWEAAFDQWRATPAADELARMKPEEAHARFAAVSPALAQGLAIRYPDAVGQLDGAPPELRYLANSVLLEREIEELHKRIAEVSAPRDHHPLRELAITALGTQLTEYKKWLAEGRQILLFDPRGDGRAVEVFGDLTAATRVGVVVPGMANSLGDFSEGDGGFRRNAINLYESAGSSDVATIAWLGYDSPDGADASLRRAAEDGADDLQRFLNGIDPGEDRELTVIAHSYGSVLAGFAASAGIEADNLVFVGSPGTTLATAHDASLRPGGRVWAALADRDPIALGVSPADLTTSWPFILDPAGLGRGLVRAFRSPEELWHGTNPADEQFDALRITTEGCSGHSDYFQAGALSNLGLIVTGRYSEVEIEG